MGLIHSPRTVTDGLVLCFDPANPRCYTGAGFTCFDLSGFGSVGLLGQGVAFSSGVAGNFILGATSSPISTGFITTLSTTFTISIWFTTQPQTNGLPSLLSKNSINATATTDAPIAIYSSGTGRNVSLSLRNGFSFAANYPVGGLDLTATNIFTPGVWANVVIKYDQVNAEIWGNGNYFTGIAWTGTLSNNTNRTYTLGRSPFEINNPANISQYAGNIGVFQMYNRSLSTSEIQQNFNALRVRYGI